MSEEAKLPTYVCGPTCGCGKSFDMVPTVNVLPPSWTLPATCPNCGQEQPSNIFFVRESSAAEKSALVDIRTAAIDLLLTTGGDAKFWQPDAISEVRARAARLNKLAERLPALLEASRRDQQTAKALEATNIGGSMDIFTDPADALTQMALYIRDLEARLSGSISERETLTAQNAELKADVVSTEESNMALTDKVRSLSAHGTCGCSYDTPRDVCAHHSPQLAEVQAAVARLTTERDTFRDWFQNAEQARAVAESKLASRSVTRCQKCGAEALPSPTHALDLEAERDEARADVERLTTEKAALSAELETEKALRLEDLADQRKEWERANAAESRREQAIHDIEALPTYDGGPAHDDFRLSGKLVAKPAVLLILRGSKPSK